MSDSTAAPSVRQKKRLHTNSRLAKFYVFDTSIPTREDTEHEKNLFFFPKSVDIELQTKDIGLAEALINFTKSFNGSKPCESVRHKKQTSVFLEVEPSIWMVLVASNPIYQTDGGHQLWAEDHLDPSVLRYILAESYRIYRLFNGSLQSNYPLNTLVRPPSTTSLTGSTPLQPVAASADPTTPIQPPPKPPKWEAEKWKALALLRAKLSGFFDHFLPHIDISKHSLIESLDGIQFMPVDAQIFLNVQSCINRTEHQFSDIISSMLIHQDFLVWSGFKQSTTRTLYSHFAKNPLGLSHLADDAGSSSSSSSSTLPPRASLASLSSFAFSSAAIAATAAQPSSPPIPRFMEPHEIRKCRPSTLSSQAKSSSSGASSSSSSSSSSGSSESRILSSGDHPTRSVPVYLEDYEAEPSVPHLAVFKHGALSFIFLLKEEPPVASFWDALFAYIAPPLHDLSQSLNLWIERRNNSNTVEESFRFIYFNSMNMAMKPVLSPDTLSREVVVLLNAMSREFVDHPERLTERVIQTRRHQWVVAKSSDQRVLYLVIDGPLESVFTIGQVDDHVQKLTTTVFGNIWW